MNVEDLLNRPVEVVDPGDEEHHPERHGHRQPRNDPKEPDLRVLCPGLGTRKLWIAGAHGASLPTAASYRVRATQETGIEGTIEVSTGLVDPLLLVGGEKPSVSGVKSPQSDF